MKFPAACDVTACAGDVRERFSSSGVAVVRRNGATYLAATDGWMASYVLAEVEPGDHVTDKPYRPEPFHEARKAAGSGRRMRTPTASVTLTADMETDAWFRDCADLVASPVEYTVSLNLDLLQKVAKALGTQRVTISFRGDDNPMTVAPHSSTPEQLQGNYGLLMPLLP